MPVSKPPSSIKEQLEIFKAKFDKRAKYVKNEYQAFGLELADALNDWSHKSLYIRLCKNTDRKILEKALYFVKDHNPGAIRSKAALFMWKLKQLKDDKTDQKPKTII